MPRNRTTIYGYQKVLIGRFEKKAENFNTPSMREHIVQLEKTIADLYAMSARFQSSHYSSTVSHENSAARISPNHVSNGNILVTATSAASENASVSANDNVQSFSLHLHSRIYHNVPVASHPGITTAVTTIQLIITQCNRFVYLHSRRHPMFICNHLRYHSLTRTYVHRTRITT